MGVPSLTAAPTNDAATLQGTVVVGDLAFANDATIGEDDDPDAQGEAAAAAAAAAANAGANAVVEVAEVAADPVDLVNPPGMHGALIQLFLSWILHSCHTTLNGRHVAAMNSTTKPKLLPHNTEGTTGCLHGSKPS